ncbi:hypothetical protein NL108_016572 [Boleophthalmus pectinirostris]|nr:hypothetical protein NL108_016572 [Boleophthalmus pectinirostris]
MWRLRRLSVSADGRVLQPRNKPVELYRSHDDQTRLSVTTYDNSIYAVGGFNRTEHLRSVEVYSPRSDSWREVASMNTTRSYFGIAVLNNRIFAVGGYAGFSTTFRVEAYDPLVDSWSEVCDMNIFRSALNCCVISDLPNMSDYTFPRHALPLLDVETDDDDEEFEDAT